MRSATSQTSYLSTYLGNSLNRASDGENTFMNARDDLADAGLYASLLTEISDVLAFPIMTPASFVLTRARRVRVSWGDGDGERDCAGEAARLSQKKREKIGKKSRYHFRVWGSRRA